MAPELFALGSMRQSVAGEGRSMVRCDSRLMTRRALSAMFLRLGGREATLKRPVAPGGGLVRSKAAGAPGHRLRPPALDCGLDGQRPHLISAHLARRDRTAMQPSSKACVRASVDPKQGRRPSRWPGCSITRSSAAAQVQPIRRLGDDIRGQLILDEGDAVAQLQLAFLEALHLDHVGAGRVLQRGDRGVEVAMLLLQARKLRPKLTFFLFCHRRLGRAWHAVGTLLGR